METANIGIKLGIGNLGRETFQPVKLKKEGLNRGINLDTGIPPGTRIMSISTAGCPKGWKKVTGVDGYHLQLTNINNNIEDTHTPGSLTHSHNVESDDASGSEVSGFAGDTDDETPVITYPAIKYLLCEKQ